MVHICGHKVVLTSTAGILTIITGILLGWIGFPYLLNKSIAQRLQIFPGNEAMERWLKTPFPLEFKVYLFNVTNADRVQVGERPIVKEVGPYVFDLYKSRVNVSYNKFNDTLEYYNKNTYYFNAEKSHPNKENDVLVLINVPLMGTATMVERIFPMGLSFVNTAIPYLFPNISSMFVKATAIEFLYDGIVLNCSYATGPAMPVCNGMRGRLPSTLSIVENSKNFKFSFFKHKNETIEGPFKMYAGNNDIKDIGKIIEYKGSEKLTMWDKNSTCSKIKGTDSTIFPPIKDKHEDIYIYVPDVCLSLVATYKNQTIMNDLTLYRYESDDKNFANEEILPENLCRCRKNENDKKPPICLKNGAIDASNCQGAPVIFTQPHFLDADPKYAQDVDGMKPNIIEHQTYVLIEPKTGIPVVGKKRMQMNMYLRKIDDITLLANVSEVLFPIAWLEEGGEIDEESMKKLTEINVVINSLDIAKWIIIAIGLGLFCASLILYAKYRALFCFNGNQISEYSYGVNTFNIDSKISNENRTPNPVIPTIAGKLNVEDNKLNGVDLPNS